MTEEDFKKLYEYVNVELSKVVHSPQFDLKWVEKLKKTI